MEEKNFGERLAAVRKMQGISQLQAAKNVGISKRTLSDYERNYRQPSLSILAALAKYYQTSADYLLGTEKKNNPVLDVSALTKDEYNAIRIIVSALQKKNAKLKEMQP